MNARQQEIQRADAACAGRRLSARAKILSPAISCHLLSAIECAHRPGTFFPSQCGNVKCLVRRAGLCGLPWEGCDVPLRARPPVPLYQPNGATAQLRCSLMPSEYDDGNGGQMFEVAYSSTTQRLDIAVQ